jgi:hypothetical protein
MKDLMAIPDFLDRKKTPRKPYAGPFTRLSSLRPWKATKNEVPARMKKAMDQERAFFEGRAERIETDFGLKTK